MKALIWIVILILVVWGIWAWMGKGSTPADNTANVSGALNDNGGAGFGPTATSSDTTTGSSTPYEDKG